MKKKKLVLIGNTAFAEIAHEYFTYDSDFEVVAFSVEASFISAPSLRDIPVVPFESVETAYAPADHYFFAACTYTKLNRVRTRFFDEAKRKGYRPASFVSPHAFVWRNVKLGEHCFVFENNVLQPFVKIGDNVVLWSGNHIGHHSRIRDNVFVASHAVISGFCDIGDNAFIGVNATVSNNVTIGRDVLIGANAYVARDVEEDKVVRGNPGEPGGSARRLNRIAA